MDATLKLQPVEAASSSHERYGRTLTMLHRHRGDAHDEVLRLLADDATAGLEVHPLAVGAAMADRVEHRAKEMRSRTGVRAKTPRPDRNAEAAARPAAIPSSSPKRR